MSKVTKKDAAPAKAPSKAAPAAAAAKPVVVAVKPTVAPAAALAVRPAAVVKAPAKAPSKGPVLPPAPTSKFNTDAVLSELKALGMATTAKAYANMGAAGTVYGVSAADLAKVAKGIGTDHVLADALWTTGVLDAQLLACIVADPKAADFKQLDRWAKSATSAPACDAMAGVAGRSPMFAACFTAWTTHRGANAEFVHRCGWSTLAAGLKNGSMIGAATLKQALATMEKTMKNAANRAREGMNIALIAIGTYRDEFADPAMALARKLGTVKVEHGESDGKDLDAATEIAKARSGLGKKAAK